MRTTRPASAVALIALAALLAGPVTAASASPAVPDARASARPVEPRDPLVPMVDVRVADFAAEAETLPPQLEQALARDAGLSGAEWLAQAEASAVGVEVVDALRDHIDVRAARLDGLELVVTVGTAAEAAVVESVGARAEIGPAADRVGEIEGLEPAADLRGGMPYFFSETGVGTFRCSIGFIGLDVVTQQSQMMSAGHCEGTSGSMRSAATINRPTTSGGTVGSPTQNIGNAGLHVTHSYPNPLFASEVTYYDLGVTPVTGAGWTPKPEVVTWGGTTSGAPLDSDPLVIRDAGPAMVGATVCKSGATTGWTCGAVTQVDSVQRVGAASCSSPGSGYCVGGIVADICVRGGDSGGPAVVGQTAVGITSASSATTGACDLGGIGVFATLYSGVPAFEQVFKVYPKWEPLVAVEAPVVNVTNAVFSGTLDHGGSRHFVDVKFSTGEVFTAQVQADGSWEVDASAGSPVTKTYTVTARWGKGSKSTSLAGTLEGIDTSRLFAADRYGTSVLISQRGFPGVPSIGDPPAGGGVPIVYLANGATFPDALSAGPAAAFEGGPLLLTPSTSLPSAIAAELDRLNPAEIVIVGGTGVVSAAVASAASEFTSGPVTRIGGVNRYETSRLIAQRMLDQGLATGQALWVATGSNFPDALSAGAAAASQGVPILLVNGSATSLDAATSSFINGTLQSNRVYIAGGTGVVSSGIQTALANLASTGTVSREGGADRFATSLKINQAAHTVSAPEVYLAYGYNFPDALSGSVIAGLAGGPLYITQTACVSSAIVEHIRGLGPSNLTVFGGTAIVSKNARDLKTC